MGVCACVVFVGIQKYPANQKLPSDIEGSNSGTACDIRNKEVVARKKEEHYIDGYQVVGTIS